MIETLPLFHRLTGQPVIVLGEGDAAEPKRRLVERAGGIIHDDIAQGLSAGARLAFIAHTDRAKAEDDAEKLRQAGVLVNVMDQPDLCDFTVPSILDRSPVLVAVGTGGASAGLAKALRLRLEQLLPPGLGFWRGRWARFAGPCATASPMWVKGAGRWMVLWRQAVCLIRLAPMLRRWRAGSPIRRRGRSLVSWKSACARTIRMI
jgi:siroheme synthase (precorrin-2 oxidase/ferrochelatase)